MATKKQSIASKSEYLRKYAEAIVKVGIKPAGGTKTHHHHCRLTGSSTRRTSLVHEVAKAAYAAGARYVDVIWGDEEMNRIRLQNAPDDSFAEYPKWHINGSHGHHQSW